MANEILYADITGVTAPISVSVADTHGQAGATASISAESTTLTIGDTVEIDLGYNSDHDVIFTGYVKIVEEKVPEDVVTIVAQGQLGRAVDYFIASTDPNQPFTRQNIAAEDFVEDLLALAGLTNYASDVSNFIYAVSIPATVNLIGAYDYIKSLADIIAWSVYSDENGIIQFRDRKPYVMGSDTSSLTIDNDGTLSITRSVSDVDLRNRVVVYGGPNGVYAEASVASPYLPAGYFKSVVVATEVLDRQNYAKLAADYNLEKLNRLTTSLSMELVGNSNVACRDVITIQNTELSINSDWYVYSLEHNWGRDGYRMNAELRQ